MKGRPFAPGQTIVRHVLNGLLEERQVLEVAEDGVVCTPSGGSMRPSYIRMPHLAYIVS
jgi:hypothetical protein